MALNRLVLVVAAIVVPLVAGCVSDRTVVGASKTPLLRYLEENGFTPFNPPRTGDGAGTIVSFDPQRRESIVFPAARCLPSQSVPQVESKVATLDLEYTLSSDAELEFSLPQLTNYQIDLKGAIGRNGVRTVGIKLLSPATHRIARGEAKDHVRSLSPNSSCIEEIKKDGNLVLHTVLGARGVEYTFIGEGGAKLSLTAEILQSIKANPTLSQQFKGSAALRVDAQSLEGGQIMLLGYRAWRAPEVPGGLKTEVEFVDLSAADVEGMRRR